MTRNFYKNIFLLGLLIFQGCSAAPKQVSDRELVERYASWTPTPGSADVENPYRQEILSRNGKIVSIIKSMYSDKALPLSIVWILGEIASPEAFPMLLSEYKKNPSPRTAISLGSSLSKENVEILFTENEELLRRILESIYGSNGQKMSEQNLNDVKEHITQNWESIVSDCKRRSIPTLG